MHFLTVSVPNTISLHCILFTWNDFFPFFVYIKATYFSLLASVIIPPELHLEDLSLVSSLFLNYYSTNIHTQGGIWVR